MSASWRSRRVLRWLDRGGGFALGEPPGRLILLAADGHELDLPDHDGRLAACARQSAASLTPGPRPQGSPASRRPLWILVGAENYVTSCDLGIFVDQAAESVPPQHADTCTFRQGIGSPGRRIMLQRPVRPVDVVVPVAVVIRPGGAGGGGLPDVVRRQGGCSG